MILGRDGGGHVGIAVGRSAKGGIAVLGGNTGDAVRVATFDPARVLGYRLPPGDRRYEPLPLLDAEMSRSEA